MDQDFWTLDYLQNGIDQPQELFALYLWTPAAYAASGCNRGCVSVWEGALVVNMLTDIRN